MRDIQPFLAADALADFSVRAHLSALAWAARCCAAVETASSLTAALARDRLATPPAR
jgi:trans-2,3-dihydro-3-hydroxyanthranilic acid synthase